MDRNPNLRITDFNEVDLGLSREEVIAEAKRCIQCKKPRCISGCPVGIDIPAFIQAIADEKFQDAADIIKKDNMLPAVCGRVCPQETQCQGECILGKKDLPISIGQLERFVADFERKKGAKCPKCAPATGKKVAVVGSGPAGLACAAELARRGHSVTVFESLHEAGGVLMYGIPAFRMPKDIVQYEIDQVKRLGVEIKTNHIVGRSVSVDELLSYDAVFLGTGAGLPYFMGIPGENLPGVYSANEFLTRVNLMGANKFPENDTPVKVGKKVVVVGGGNVAMDAARVARRMGAEVTLMYRRGEADMPARLDEVRHAKEEGIIFMTATNPIAILGGNNTVCGVQAVKMELGTAGDDGRCSFYPIEGSEFVVEADVVIEAIGQGPNPLLLRMMPELTRNRNGSVAVNCLGETSIPKVYAGGDVATGAATVILAMGTAKEAAVAIDTKLRK
ncbi:MAG: NADPH-dependent glutamate synthase [Methanocorpusculum sp.]|uniref:NADPH-dependent glutamate synthase n=1 Tax=Methanocorpusculum sp. TaxID=2058474 RepID=UPI002B1F9A11|nr:NADPH-dependent glutamate synthase [Methanocorpusculum sp.]MEA5086259.1 NADPH-dependent glutamate synthase [Methanocorpusculum sp.]